MNPFTATGELVQSAKEWTETDGIDSNLPDDSDFGNEQDNEDGGGVPDDPVLWTISMSEINEPGHVISNDLAF